MDIPKDSIDVVEIYVCARGGSGKEWEAKHMLVHKQETLSVYIVHKLNKNNNKLLQNKTIFNWNSISMQFAMAAAMLR